MSTARRIEYSENDKGYLIDATQAPFDGNPVLIQLAEGWAEAYWIGASSYEGPNGREFDGFCWCVMDDSSSEDIDSVEFWAPLPEPAV
jgi:hypothetical protein